MIPQRGRAATQKDLNREWTRINANGIMKITISQCLMCDSTQVSRKKGDFICHDGFRVRNIAHSICERCGEKFYDQDASRAIDRALIATGRLKKRNTMAMQD